MQKLDSPYFVLSALIDVPLQVYREHTQYVSVLLIKKPFLNHNALNWEVTYKNLVNKVVCDPSNHQCMMHYCTDCPGTNTLHKFLEEELNNIDFQFHYSQWQTT